MMNRRHFQRGTPTFKCAVCTRLTRNPDHGGTELCSECYELSGLDNYVNDNGLEMTPERLAERDALFNAAVSKGGDAERIKGCNDFLWRPVATKEAY